MACKLHQPNISFPAGIFRMGSIRGGRTAEPQGSRATASARGGSGPGWLGVPTNCAYWRRHSQDLLEAGFSLGRIRDSLMQPSGTLELAGLAIRLAFLLPW
jgi:hypothetical protein